jgi:hypothetical protein
VDTYRKAATYENGRYLRACPDNASSCEFR